MFIESYPLWKTTEKTQKVFTAPHTHTFHFAYRKHPLESGAQKKTGNRAYKPIANTHSSHENVTFEGGFSVVYTLIGSYLAGDRHKAHTTK